MRPRFTFLQLDEFLRIYQIGFVAVWPVLGLASATAWSAESLAALVVISAAFNTFGGVLNDICDLNSDRLADERLDRWLVSGAVSTSSAAWLVVAQVPLMLVAHLAAGFRTESLGWLGLAVAGEAFYDFRGKKSNTPPIAEAGQALAAGSLVCYGATCVVAHFSRLTLYTAVAAWAMLHLANAFHGGLRDLGDDFRARVRTTPLWLGCEARGNELAISPAMSCYGALWLAIIMVASLAAAFETDPAVGAVVFVECGIVIALFASLHRLRKPAWDLVLKLHVTTLPVPMMTVYMALLGAAGSMTLLLVYLVPSLPNAYRILRATRPKSQPDGLAAPV